MSSVIATPMSTTAVTIDADKIAHLCNDTKPIEGFKHNVRAARKVGTIEPSLRQYSQTMDNKTFLLDALHDHVLLNGQECMSSSMRIPSK
jgi:hypothetical protein